MNQVRNPRVKQGEVESVGTCNERGGGLFVMKGGDYLSMRTRYMHTYCFYEIEMF